MLCLNKGSLPNTFISSVGRPKLVLLLVRANRLISVTRNGLPALVDHCRGRAVLENTHLNQIKEAVLQDT